MRKLLSVILVGTFLTTTNALAKEEVEFISPIDDGKIIVNYDEEKNYHSVDILDQNAVNDMTETSIVASEDGTVSGLLYHLSTDTYSIIIDHEDGYSTKYSNLKEIDVELKDKVKQGDIIANAKNNRLGFIIIKDGKRLENTKELIAS
ncbi:MAG: M23 family metallopeptidase [Erysipelotrichaceae bacterium]|nr:M23 family metallopeptidase [Erysipelotrichaceae bacterium]MDY5252895.1 M23 family metallopeptidase [Erysipelotrichaceae bacterium]